MPFEVQVLFLVAFIPMIAALLKVPCHSTGLWIKSSPHSQFSNALSLRTTRLCTTGLSSKNSPSIDLEEGGKGPQHISWYPGHIAKAERELSDYLKKVDLVIEVRDARIPLSTTHPSVPTWVAKKPLIVAVARLDQVSPRALKDWREYYAQNPAHAERPEAKIYFIDGKRGAGVLSLKREALKAGVAINEKRARRGIQPRAVRAAVIGFPNVGKSALINRLLGKKMAASRNMPGVTRALRWVRMGGAAGAQAGTLELLDSPGIIPARQFDQTSAMRLAICNDIGEASYDRVVVAAAMCDRINRMYQEFPCYVDMDHIVGRYDMPFDQMSGEEIVYEVAQRSYQGNSISAADKLLGDFRKNLLRYGSLEGPTSTIAMLAAGTASGKGGDVIISDSVEREAFQTLDIGKGNYEGW